MKEDPEEIYTIGKIEPNDCFLWGRIVKETQRKRE